MITSVEIDGFRCFKKLRVDGLTRVNVIVGANNSGKTVLLEAIEAVASHESSSALYRSSIERGEFRQRPGPEAPRLEVDPRHWFHGHALAPGIGFTVRGMGDRERLVSRTIAAMSASDSLDGGKHWLVTDSRGAAIGLLDDDWLIAGSPSKLRKTGLRLRPPVGFVTTARLPPGELAPLWTNIVLTPGEQHTVEALRLIEPAIERIAIVESDGPIAKVLLRGAESPVPLGTLGEGVSRIFALALNLVLTEGGFLLIDEIAHVSVHRLEARREASVRFDASRIAEYVEMELEAR